MNYASRGNPATLYQDINSRSTVAEASPHRLIQMLLERALARIAAACGHMERAEVAQKGAHISGALAIIDGLQSALNPEAGGEIAANLGALYDYMGRRLVEGNARDDVEALKEVSSLLHEIKEAWDAIADHPAASAAAQVAEPALAGA